MLEAVRYHPDTDQLALAEAFDDSIASLLPIARLHDGNGESAETWAQLEGLGLFGIGLSEDLGGSGLGAAEEALIAVGLGRRLASPSVLATIGLTHAGLKVDIYGGAKAPRAGFAYRHGGRIVIADDAEVDLLIVRDGASAAVYNVPRPQPAALDDHFWLAQLREVTDLGEPIVTFDPAQALRLRLLDAAYLAGLAEAARDMGVAYAGMREQFGRPIGTFQAIKHHCADMAIAARCAVDQTSFASIAIDDGRDEAALQVDCALLVAGNAAIDNAGKNIQIHGGIGFSEEADPHLILKRAQLLIAIAGGLEATNNRIAAIPPRR